jgi:hypothetical protein
MWLQGMLHLSILMACVHVQEGITQLQLCAYAFFLLLHSIDEHEDKKQGE